MGGRYSDKIAVGQENRMDAPEGWSFEDDGKALVRTLKFKDFSEAFGFLRGSPSTPRRSITIPSSPACGTASTSG